MSIGRILQTQKTRARPGRYPQMGVPTIHGCGTVPRCHKASSKVVMPTDANLTRNRWGDTCAYRKSDVRPGGRHIKAQTRYSIRASAEANERTREIHGKIG